MPNPLLFLALNTNQAYFLREFPDGRRSVSWRTWLLTFLIPGLFLAAAAFFAFESLSVVLNYERTTGKVVRVYDWPEWTPWTGDTTTYSPVFEYRFSAEETTQASTGMSSPNWNWPIGSEHEILFDPRLKTDVKQPLFEQLWALPVTIAAIGGVTLVPALVVASLLIGWLRRAKPRPVGETEA